MGAPNILVVDDEQDLADLYAMWIGDEYRTATAYGGEEALEKMNGAVDIVLLDRRMPDMTGDEVLDTIRQRGYDCKVIMVTAVDPGLDIIEMDFDKYLTKPISRPQLHRIIESMRIQTKTSSPVQQHQSISNKMETLEREHDAEKLEGSEAYSELQDRLKHLTQSITDDDEPAAADGAAADDDGPDDLAENFDEFTDGLDEANSEGGA